MDARRLFLTTFIGRKWLFRIARNRLAVARPRKLLALLILGVALLLIYGSDATGQSKAAPSFPPKDKSAFSTAGAKAYSANCAGCHGLDGKGGERAPDIVARPEVRQLSNAAVLQILQKGVPNTSMPSFGFLDTKTRNAVVAHLRTLQGATAVAKLTGNAQHGRDIFFNKGSCASCHMARGEGGFFAANLDGYARGRSPESVRGAIVSPNRDLDPRHRTVVATLSAGRTLEGIARNEDNFSLQLLTPDGTLHLLNKSSLASLTYREQSPMPADYGTKLSSAELDDLVNFLFSLAEEKSGRSTKDDQEED